MGHARYQHRHGRRLRSCASSCNCERDFAIRGRNSPICRIHDVDGALNVVRGCGERHCLDPDRLNHGSVQELKVGRDRLDFGVGHDERSERMTCRLRNQHERAPSATKPSGRICFASASRNSKDRGSMCPRPMEPLLMAGANAPDSESYLATNSASAVSMCLRWLSTSVTPVG
jgi:hypothetical protein